MPYKKEYDFSLNVKFEGAHKPEHWEPINAAIINKWMDQGLPIFVDVATCLADHIQASLHEGSTAPTSTSNTTTPATSRRLARELRNLDNNGSGEPTGDGGGSSSGVVQAAPGERALRNLPLKPSMLADPSFAEEWNKALTDNPSGDLLTRLKWERGALLGEHRKDYNDKAAMHAADDAELELRQLDLLAQILRTINRQIIRSFQECFLKDGDTSVEQDALRSILSTRWMKDIALGKYYDAAWWSKPYEMPAIQAYVSLIHHFENINDQGNVNLVTKLMEVMEAAQTDSVTTIVQKFDKIMDPIARTFTTVESFTDYIKSSLQYEVVRRRSKLKGPKGRAWRKAHDYLREAVTDGQRLTLDLLQYAVKLAEAHLRDNATDAPTDGAKEVRKTEAEEAGPAKSKSWRERRARKRIKTLEAQIAGTTPAPATAAATSPRPKPPAKGGKPFDAARGPPQTCATEVEDEDDDSNESSDEYPPVCDLMKGARRYRKSKRMREHAKRQEKRQHVRHSSILRQTISSEAEAVAAAAAAAAAAQSETPVCPSPARQRVRFHADTIDTCKLHSDDFLHMFKTATPESRRSCFKIQHDLHVDYAHSISLGYHNQLYYLVMVVDGKDFLWATPTTTKSSPETLIEDFLRHTNVTIGKIRIDNAGELSRSESFKLWCASRDIVLCPTAGYNHTMQARAEGAVRITKEHIRCLLKTANMPFMFWPWALTQFCRMYNYWPCKGHAPPWIMLGDHRFSQSLHRDLHPFGCYTIGTLPREHPDVTNTTLSDRGLEGAFLGWDLATPTCWIWSFRKKKPVRLHDPVFYDKRFPFSDPTCLVNRDDLSLTAEDEDDELSQRPTQQPETTPVAAPAKRPTPSGEHVHSGERTRLEQPDDALHSAPGLSDCEARSSLQGGSDPTASSWCRARQDPVEPT
mmetsp:Transcript_30800/g.63788  ORF Transcript_30800/g.63788 Transcript_30800/m.63788 type:complete len:919 (-) Transcript_30800:650-3406(-)